PTSAIAALAATNDVKLISLVEETAQQIADETLYVVNSIEPDSSYLLTEPARTPSVAATQVASTSPVSPDVAYEITAATFDQAEQITLPQSELITHDYALFGQGDVPLHPGAEQYYEEQGLL